MKTASDFRTRAALELKIFRWVYLNYKEKPTIEKFMLNSMWTHYTDIRMLYEIGLISARCIDRAYYMYATIRRKYHNNIREGLLYGNK